MNKIVNFIIQLIIFALLAFGLHLIFQQVLGLSDSWNNTGYSLYLIYLFELMLSILMIIVVVSAGKSLSASLGYIFLGLLTIKCVANFFFIQPVLDAENPNNFIKHNFLIIFLIFLVFDVYVAFKILNQPSVKTELK